MKKTVRSIIILSLVLFPFDIYAVDVYKSFQSGRFDAYLESEYFKTESNYDANGNKQGLASGYSFTDIQMLTSARYVFFNKGGFFGGLSFSNVESNNLLSTRKKSVLTNVFLGADYQIWSSELWSIYTDVTYVNSNDKVELNQDTAIASNGASELKIQFTGILRNTNFNSFARIGYSNRSEGLSSLLLYGLGGGLILGDVTFGAEFDGFSSVKDDQQTNTPAVRENITNQVNAGSKKYYSINPNLLKASGYLSYAFDPNFVVKVNVGTTLVGSNSAEGLFAGASVNWGFGAKEKRPGKRTKRVGDVENKSGFLDNEPGFKIETEDGVDQELFKNSEPVKKKK